MKTGNFLNFHLPFEQKDDGTITSVEQAWCILKKAQQLLKDKTKKVAIIYSANYGQTHKIKQIYATGKWHTKTDGANQVEVMNVMESEFSELNIK